MNFIVPDKSPRLVLFSTQTHHLWHSWVQLSSQRPGQSPLQVQNCKGSLRMCNKWQHVYFVCTSRNTVLAIPWHECNLCWFNWYPVAFIEIFKKTLILHIEHTDHNIFPPAGSRCFHSPLRFFPLCFPSELWACWAAGCMWGQCTRWAGCRTPPYIERDRWTPDLPFQ